jgi:ATPase family associated with various cellular activities (AAA)
MPQKEKLLLHNKEFAVLDKETDSVNLHRLFFAYYNEVPNTKYIAGLNTDKAFKIFASENKEQIVKVHYSEYFNHKQKKMCYIQIIYFLKNGIAVHIDAEMLRVAFTNENETIAQGWIEWAKTFKKKEPRLTNEICLVTTSSFGGLETTAIKIKKPKLNLTQNYNYDIVEIHQSMVKKLREKNANGLFLFHGLPGTGKSTYIRFLIHHLNKKVIFMSPKLAGNLDAPELMSFLLRNANAVIVIEDAEDLISERETSRNSSISTLLNLTDGLLSECLNIQVIATFNTHITNIDKALLRKGRLQALYQFKELSVAKSNDLLQQIGVNNYYTNKAMTLAEIYNTKEESYQFKNERTPIGFIQ